MGLRTEVLKSNFEAMRRGTYPDFETLVLEELDIETREFAQLDTLDNGWALEREIDTVGNRSIMPVLKIAATATLGQSGDIADDDVFERLAAVQVNGQRYLTKLRAKSNREPDFYEMDLELVQSV